MAMARLILSLDGQTLAEYNLSRERYTIGRLADNDIRIDNAAVSGHHALIINILNDSFLEDLNSTNGTYVGGRLIRKHALQHGDVITVGHHQLRFIDGEESESDREAFEKTMVLSPSDAAATQLRPKTESTRPMPAAGAAAALPSNARLQVLSGAQAGRDFEVVKAVTMIGRTGIQVAAVTRRADGYYLIHVDSRRANDYPLVNGAPIGGTARRLADNDVITVAGVKMGFLLG
jgi:pSer/pThr/pTyr-binding forkhead associated (FHA) protein